MLDMEEKLEQINLLWRNIIVELGDLKMEDERKEALDIFEKTIRFKDRLINK